MVPVHIQLIYLVEDILAQLDILGSRSATLILVCRDVCPEGLQIRQAVSGHHHISALSFYQLDTLIIVPWTHLSPIPSVVEPCLPTARVSPHTDIADEPIF